MQLIFEPYHNLFRVCLISEDGINIENQQVFTDKEQAEQFHNELKIKYNL
jgi:hypothetical protein